MIRDYRRGLSDRDVLVLAVREQRILITDDKDFGDLVFKEARAHAGVLLFRLKDADLEARITRLQAVLDAYAERLDEFLVISPKAIRIRR